MDPSVNKIQPSEGPDKPAAATIFAGTVTGIKKEGDVQTVEIQFSQGKVRFQAEGDFQAGEKVRLSFPGNGSVQIAKGAEQTSMEDWQGVDYTLPRNLSTFKDLGGFEDKLVQWMGSKAAASADAGASAWQGALAELTLPQLMVQTVAAPGGKDYLSQALAGMDPHLMPTLLDALEETAADAGAKSMVTDLVKSVAKSAALVADEKHAPGEQAALGQAGRHAPGQSAASAAEAFLPAESGTGHAPWFGRIMDKQAADGFLTPMQRLQFAGPGAAGLGGPGNGNGPMFRYLLDMGGRGMEVYSSQSLEPGAFTDFQLEKQGGRVQAKFTDPAAALPAGLRTAMAGASPEVRQGMVLASRYLQDFKEEPYYGQLVEDFGEVLAQSGRMNPPTADGKPAGIPDRQELDGLLKLFVAFPRDAVAPEKQARVWGDAVKDPQAVMKLLKALQPEEDASLLRARTALRLAAEGKDSPERIPAAVEALLSEASKSGESPEATAAWLKKLLPEAFKPEDLLNLAKDASPLTAAGKEHEAAKFLLQAVSDALPREDQIQEGRPAQFYFYQGQEWRNLQVTWERGGDRKDGRGKPGPKAPLQVKVVTSAKHMGQVNVGVSWEPKGAKLDFRNQYHNVRDLLSKSLPELEKSLALMGFRVAAWSYELMPNETPAVPDPGWTRPASLSDGKNLDLLG